MFHAKLIRHIVVIKSGRVEWTIKHIAGIFRQQPLDNFLNLSDVASLA